MDENIFFSVTPIIGKINQTLSVFVRFKRVNSMQQLFVPIYKTVATFYVEPFHDTGDFFS